jgi:hypothetical protein
MTPLSARAALSVVLRPDLWPTALRVAFQLGAPGWWRRWPPLPVLPEDYARFRSQAMYGTERATLSPEDLVAYLEWCRRMHRLAR